MLKFSANLGFLWTELDLPHAIHAAKSAGFDAVEFHYPYAFPSGDVKKALKETEMPMIGLNTWPGDMGRGELGLCALTARQADAKAVIDQAIEYAIQIDAKNIHVVAGIADGEDATHVFLSNLEYAVASSSAHHITILIEPLNAADAPGYFLSSLELADQIISKVASPNLKLMFDCYHIHRMGYDVIAALKRYYPVIGHIQIAGSPDRGMPDQGQLDYLEIFRTLEAMNHTAPIGAEYKPQGKSEDSLKWLNQYRSEH